MKITRTRALLTALLGSAFAIQVLPALAQTSPGPDWVLSGTTPHQDWIADPANPGGDGHWKLTAFNDRQYFVPDGAVQRRLSSSSQDRQEIQVGTSGKVFGNPVVVQRTPGHSQTLLRSLYRQFVENNSLITTKLVRQDNWEDRLIDTPWTRYSQYAIQSRTLSNYTLQWTDPITGQTLSEADPQTDVGPWVVGAAYNKEVAGTGTDESAQRVTLPSNQLELRAGKTLLQLAGVSVGSALSNTRSSSFLSDRSSGASKVVVQGSKVRRIFQADDAVASLVRKKDQPSGGLSITPQNPLPTPTPVPTPTPTPAPTPTPSVAPLTINDWVGTFVSSDGAHEVTITLSNSNGQKVPRMTLLQKDGNSGNYRAQATDTDPPSGSMSDATSYSDSQGPAFYTNGAVTISQSGQNVVLNGTLKGTDFGTGGREGTFSITNFVRQSGNQQDQQGQDQHDD